MTKNEKTIQAYLNSIGIALAEQPTTEKANQDHAARIRFVVDNDSQIEMRRHTYKLVPFEGSHFIISSGTPKEHVFYAHMNPKNTNKI